MQCLCINYGRTLVRDHSDMLFVSIYKLRSSDNLTIPTVCRAGRGLVPTQYNAGQYPTVHPTGPAGLTQLLYG